jgi:hypothetical protein
MDRLHPALSWLSEECPLDRRRTGERARSATRVTRSVGLPLRVLVVPPLMLPRSIGVAYEPAQDLARRRLGDV